MFSINAPKELINPVQFKLEFSPKFVIYRLQIISAPVILNRRSYVTLRDCHMSELFLSPKEFKQFI